MTIAIKAHVHKQAFDYTLWFNKPFKVQVTSEDLNHGFITIPCADCDGTGRFELPDGEAPSCVACKGSGREYVNVI